MVQRLYFMIIFIFFITEGQAIGIRISKKFSANFSKIKKEVDFLNTVSNGVEDVKNFLSPSSSVFDQLTTRKLSANQQQAVQAKCLNDHSREEYANIEQEIKQFMSHLSFQSEEILEQIIILSRLEKSRQNLGMLQYLHQKHLDIERLYSSCRHLFEDVVITSIPSIVGELLQKAQSTLSQNSLDMPSEEDIRAIIEEIEMAENHYRDVDEEEEDYDEDDEEEYQNEENEQDEEEYQDEENEQDIE